MVNHGDLQHIFLTFNAFPEHMLAKTLLGIEFILTSKLIIDIPQVKFSFSQHSNFKFDLSFKSQTSSITKGTMKFSCAQAISEQITW